MHSCKWLPNPDLKKAQFLHCKYLHKTIVVVGGYQGRGGTRLVIGAASPQFPTNQRPGRHGRDATISV